MNILEKWSIKIAAAKISRRAIPWLVGLITGPSVAGLINEKLTGSGVTVVFEPMGVQAALGMGLSYVTNWAKVKFGLKFL